MVDPAALERETQRVGRELHEAFPAATRHPLKVLDGKAMDYAASDQALRAALFRFVDVVPACRSLDDLARHLTEYVGEVDQRPPSLDAAMRLGHTKAGRAALGAAAAAGVRHMAHRFIIAEDHRAVVGHLRGLWRHGVASSLDLLGEATVTAPRPMRTPRVPPTPCARSARRPASGPPGRGSSTTSPARFRARTCR